MGSVAKYDGILSAFLSVLDVARLHESRHSEDGENKSRLNRMTTVGVRERLDELIDVEELQPVRRVRKEISNMVLHLFQARTKR